MRACFVVLGAIACGFVLAETAEPVESNPFVPSIQSIPQLIASQEIQRRWADVVLGTAQAYQWLSYASIEGRKAEQANAVKGSLEETMDSHDLTKAAALENSPFRAAANDDDDDDVAVGDNSVNANDDDDDDVSMLELKSGFTPFMGGMGMGMGMGYGGYGMPFGGFGGFYPSAAPAASTPAAPASPMDLEEQSTAAKQNALKYMQIQLYLVANDVEKTYWVNKILASLLPPQLMYMKLYKQYLTTLGLGLAFQLHDAFTLESRLDDFNDHFLSTATPGTTLKSEAVAEVQVYSNWYSLAMIKMQLFYISMYERSMMSGIQRQATNGAFQSASSFLELKADPETPFAGMMGNQGMLAQQYAAFSQYLSLMRLYIMFSETSLASTGLMAASTKSKSVDMAFDKDPSNDGEAGKLRTQAAAIETQWLPRLFQQWATTTLIKFQLEQFLLIMDVQIPQLLAARVAERADSSLQDMNLVQTDAPTTTPAAAN